MFPQNDNGLTLVEALVIVAIIGALAFLALPAFNSHPHRGGTMTQTLSHMKQLQMATQMMALDGMEREDTNLGWPGDTDGTFSNWTAQLLKGKYLTESDLCKLLSAPGIVVKKLSSTNNTALLVYAIREDNDGNAVFLSTANFTNTPTGGILDPNAKPYGNKGFVVFRKAADGVILAAKQAGQTNLIGSYVPLCR